MVLAHILRTGAHPHRPLPADSPSAQAIEVLARARQDMVWSRQHEVNRLRSRPALYYPAALAAFSDLTTRTAMAVLAAAPTPARAARLTTSDLLDLLDSARQPPRLRRDRSHHPRVRQKAPGPRPRHPQPAAP
jgi:hypothetical protein